MKLAKHKYKFIFFKILMQDKQFVKAYETNYILYYILFFGGHILKMKTYQQMSFIQTQM